MCMCIRKCSSVWTNNNVHWKLVMVFACFSHLVCEREREREGKLNMLMVFIVFLLKLSVLLRELWYFLCEREHSTHSLITWKLLQAIFGHFLMSKQNMWCMFLCHIAESRIGSSRIDCFNVNHSLTFHHHVSLASSDIIGLLGEILCVKLIDFWWSCMLTKIAWCVHMLVVVPLTTFVISFFCLGISQYDCNVRIWILSTLHSHTHARTHSAHTYIWISKSIYLAMCTCRNASNYILYACGLGMMKNESRKTWA